VGGAAGAAGVVGGPAVPRADAAGELVAEAAGEAGVRMVAMKKLSWAAPVWVMDPSEMATGKTLPSLRCPRNSRVTPSSLGVPPCVGAGERMRARVHGQGHTHTLRYWAMYPWCIRLNGSGISTATLRPLRSPYPQRV
jgi:hypothetical protein